MTESEFDRLIERYRSSKLPEGQRALVDKWLEMKTEYKDTTSISDARITELEAQLMQRIDETDNVRRLIPVWLKAAAAIMVLAIASFTVWQVMRIETLHVQTTAQTQKMILPDGSIVWLKENSTLTYPEKFSGKARTVSFTGEALFEVTKDPNQPFIIACNGVTAKVLGTSFSIKSTAQNTEVIVLTGKVSVTAGSNHEMLVMPNEKAVYASAANAIAKTALPEADVLRITSGTEYTMSFEAATLAHIVKRVESKFNVAITLSDAALGNCRITADLTDQSLVLTLDKISEILGSTYVIHEHEVRLSGEGCN